MTRILTRRRLILQIGPRDFSVLVWIRDEGDEPVYRVVKDKIKAASTAAVLAQHSAGGRRGLQAKNADMPIVVSLG